MTKLYDSNNDSFTTPTESGWYIQWRSESNDQGWFKSESVITDSDHALSILKDTLNGEWAGGQFYAYVKSFTYIDVEAEANSKEISELGQKFISVCDGDNNTYSIPENLLSSWDDWKDGDPYDVYQEWNEYCIY